MQDHDTQCVYQLSDLTNARLSRPKVAYTEVGKVNGANKLCLVIDLVQPDTYYARPSPTSKPGKLRAFYTGANTLDQLPPLEIVLEVRGTQAIPTSFRVVAQPAVQPIA
jgi:hypothetical protein